MTFTFLSDLSGPSDNFTQSSSIGQPIDDPHAAASAQSQAFAMQHQEGRGASSSQEYLPQQRAQPPQQQQHQPAHRTSPSRPVREDPEGETKELLKALLTQMSMQHHHRNQKMQELQQKRQQLSKKVDNLASIIYALLALCIVMTILLIVVVYKVHNINVAGADRYMFAENAMRRPSRYP